MAPLIEMTLEILRCSLWLTFDTAFFILAWQETRENLRLYQKEWRFQHGPKVRTYLFLQMSWQSWIKISQFSHAISQIFPALKSQINAHLTTFAAVSDSGSTERMAQKRKMPSPSHSSNGHSSAETSPCQIKKKKKPGALGSSKDQVTITTKQDTISFTQTTKIVSAFL